MLQNKMRSNWLTNLKYFQAISFVTVAWVVTVSSADAQVADENGIYINKRPLKDWSKRFSEEVISKRIDLELSIYGFHFGNAWVGK